MKKHPIGGAGMRARTLRQNMTEAEKRVWQILRSCHIKGHKFRRQVPIGRSLPILCAMRRGHIVEIDGGQHDRSSPRQAERRKFLQSEGYRMLRFWNNEVLVNQGGGPDDALPPPRWGRAGVGVTRTKARDAD